METFGNFLRDLRQKRRLTLGQLALRSGVSKPTLSRWEAETYLPQIAQFNRAFDALRVSRAERAKGLRLLNVPRAIQAERRGDAPAPMRVSLGDLFYGLRQRSGKTQFEVAREAGVSRSLYSQWENDTTQPTTEQIHKAGFALHALPEEVIALSTGAFASAPMERTRDAFLARCQDMRRPDFHLPPAAYHLYLLSLLGLVSSLMKAGKADSGETALILTLFGSHVDQWLNDQSLARQYHHRALTLAERAEEPLHIHTISGICHALLTPSKHIPVKKQVDAALKWRSRFADKARQAYLLSFIAGALSQEAPDAALRLADVYCALVAGDAEERPHRLRDRGNLLFKCGRFAESVAFIDTLTPRDPFREGLKQFDMARSLIALGALAEARYHIGEARRFLFQKGHALYDMRITEMERAVS